MGLEMPQPNKKGDARKETETETEKGRNVYCNLTRERDLIYGVTGWNTARQTILLLVRKASKLNL